MNLAFFVCKQIQQRSYPGSKRRMQGTSDCGLKYAKTASFIMRLKRFTVFEGALRIGDEITSAFRVPASACGVADAN